MKRLLCRIGWHQWHTWRDWFTGIPYRECPVCWKRQYYHPMGKWRDVPMPPPATHLAAAAQGGE